MFELNGKFNSCKVFTDNVDMATISQLTNLLNQESVKNSKIRIMPDTHAGKGCVIGTTMTITDKVISNLVGVDVGCGMAVAKLNTRELDLPKLDDVIHKQIPAGFNIRSRSGRHEYWKKINLNDLQCAKSVDLERAYNSIGTLGGGNHFIEVNRDTKGNLYLVVHTGSRNLGKQVAEYYQEEAWKKLKNGNRGELIKQKIAELTALGRQSEIEQAIKEIKSTIETVPYELAYCEGELFNSYIHDMKIAQEFAHWNRVAIVDTITKAMKVDIDEEFQTIHNYIDTDNMILRKGSISARLGEKVIIPMNMRDGSLICIGKGNDDWNQSAPHGAGRLMSRGEAKRVLTVSDFEKTMSENGIYTTSVGQSTLDEAPMAYKPMQEIIDNIGDTVDIIEIIKPIYNFKASE